MQRRKDRMCMGSPRYLQGNAAVIHTTSVILAAMVSGGVVPNPTRPMPGTDAWFILMIA